MVNLFVKIDFYFVYIKVYIYKLIDILLNILVMSKVIGKDTCDKIKVKINRSKKIISDLDIEQIINSTDNIDLNKVDNKNKHIDQIDIEIKDVSVEQIFINITDEYKNKEEKITLWDNSIFKTFTTLTSNNRGNVGENFIDKICSICKINGKISGISNKGKSFDGSINGKKIEIKTAYLGNCGSFQHELGEEPWKPDYMLFIDVSPESIYLTIFKNFSEEKYSRPLDVYKITGK